MDEKEEKRRRKSFSHERQKHTLLHGPMRRSLLGLATLVAARDLYLAAARVADPYVSSNSELERICYNF